MSELPEPVPPLRPKPPKPGLFASQEVKDDYEAWEQEKLAHQAANRKRNKLLVADHAKARELAIANEVRSQQLDVVIAEKAALAEENQTLKKRVGELAGLLNLFRPEEIEAAQARRKLEQAESNAKAREQMRQLEAAKAAHLQEIQRETVQEEKPQSRPRRSRSLDF